MHWPMGSRKDWSSFGGVGKMGSEEFVAEREQDEIADNPEVMELTGE